MSLSPQAIHEIRVDGHQDNGGAFDRNGCTFSATLSTANGTSDTPTVTASNYTFVASDVGHWLYIHGGTNWRAGWYLIQSVAGGAATVQALPNRWGAMNAGLRFWTGVSTTAIASSGQWSIDYSQSAVAPWAYTDLVIGTPNTDITSAAFPFGPNHVANCVRVISGTGFTAGRYRVLSIQAGNAARLSAAVGTSGSTGGVGRTGGAIPLHGGSLAWAGLSFVRSGTYDVDMTLAANAVGGPIDTWHTFIGYGSERMDFLTRPLIRAATNPGAAQYVMSGGSNYIFLEVDCMSRANVSGFGANRCAILCAARNIAANRVGFSGGHNLYCLAENPPAASPAVAVGQGFNSARTVSCVALWLNQGFTWDGIAVDCIAESCATGFRDLVFVVNCAAVGCNTGYSTLGNSEHWRSIFNSVSIASVGTAMNAGNAANRLGGLVFNNAAFGGSFNFAEIAASTSLFMNNITLPGNPFVDMAARNYRLANNTAGNMLRGAGYSPLVSAGLTRVAGDIGVIDEPSTTGGGGGGPAGFPASRVYNSGG